MQSLGTIVYLKDGRARVMIINRGPIIEKEGISCLYDFAGCVYPIGMNPEQVLYFNEENIDKVLFEGYRDEDEQRFEELYVKSVEDLSESVMKGLPNLNLKS
ncbi:DUF4176 domain-containing protein [Enterococcus quebecensis]|uniref:Type II secretion protein n=1 Tax=Enterococcus quebecensis TaxID=903983 RepID=A0A1E5GV10_9ENTE|nr:DUF4176 domain-containing protein [Enterococcus quebecensis]OEG16467.1 type II secretion protein [Enterococcus quebecensis]OJG74165.1 type II secretion protein [Enterococcus quebecensis]